jgi:putative mRNA 3-end processing factor
VYLHGSLEALCNLYRAHGIELGDTPPAMSLPRGAGGGEIILCPPSALNDRWSRRFAEPLAAMASGWMGIRQRAKQRGVELPLAISDHADWDELARTIDEIRPSAVWVTHGREEALVHHARSRGYAAEALNLAGYDEESA